MRRRQWLFHVARQSLLYRRGRSLLLVSVVAMAASLVTALGIVSQAIGEKVGDELRRYGANIVVLPASAPVSIGSGSFRFGTVDEPAWLDERAATLALAAAQGNVKDYSLHLRGLLHDDLPAEGVDFARVRRLFPWWQIRGAWPEGSAILVGSDLAATLSISPGSTLSLEGGAGSVTVYVAGIVSTGGDEDRLLLLPLGTMQNLLELQGMISEARVVAAPGAGIAQAEAHLRAALPGAQVREVRQVARTSEELLRKVQLLMLFVTAVVVVTSGASVAGTMSTSILERGREIGLLKAVGGTRRSVVVIFAVEAAAFGTVGGAIGYAAGVGIAAAVMRTVFGAGPILAPLFLPLALGTGLLLVFAGSIGPLAAVFRLDPVQSLRGE